MRISGRSAIRAVYLLSVSLWVVSLNMPAVTICGSDGAAVNDEGGAFVLVQGWLALPGGLAWLANPFWVIVVSFRLMFGASSVLLPFVVAMLATSAVFMTPEAGWLDDRITVCRYLSGFWIWLIAMWLPFITELLNRNGTALRQRFGPGVGV